jgi:hypothetical protein
VCWECGFKERVGLSSVDLRSVGGVVVGDVVCRGESGVGDVGDVNIRIRALHVL